MSLDEDSSASGCRSLDPRGPWADEFSALTVTEARRSSESVRVKVFSPGFIGTNCEPLLLSGATDSSSLFTLILTWAFGWPLPASQVRRVDPLFCPSGMLTTVGLAEMVGEAVEDCVFGILPLLLIGGVGFGILPLDLIGVAVGGPTGAAAAQSKWCRGKPFYGLSNGILGCKPFPGCRKLPRPIAPL